ncbi:LLM class flavin-dependent oxidoreductase [Rhodococcus spelaei]|uniref:LLM class flavin-dependent oxidoreductase n=1 Tax=Rhodococcus spelaei TaxID=2546320 RepID=A0A541BP46_9NOCA|nr:LLM class flavin-dependent oxidoreductase [Rhodococcus spelaei]TQF74107.1 LLM class flavin-dependent oxidoreductase [Rhodococcus spelaei]
MRVVVVEAPTGSGRQWAERARVLDEQGFDALLVPDTLWTPSPFPALAAAAAVTRTLRLRTWVAAAPLRTAAALTRECRALQALSDGRFELGIGAGRPDAEAEAGRLGTSWGTAAQRIHAVEESVAAVRAGVDPVPEVVVSAAGPRMLAAAGRVADRVALALGPTTTEADLADAVERARETCGRAMTFTQSLVGIGDALPSYFARTGGPTLAELLQLGSAGLLPADPGRAADVLCTREEELGIAEVTVPGELSEAFAPVLARLRR